jgi:hypothetical protein
VSQDQADGSCEITSMNKTQADGSYGVGGGGFGRKLANYPGGQQKLASQWK